MSFTNKDWKDYPDTTTPITAAALEDLENRVVGAGLQLLSGTGKKVAWGTGNTPNYSSSTVPTTGNIAHGLGVEPAVVIASASPVNNGSVQMPVTVSVDTKDATNIVLRFHAPKADGTGYDGPNYSVYYWVAIG